ncbi:cell cycle control protein cwf8/ubiquitin-protein ligase E4 [Blumeria hordei DH14]|uniref:Pre-mRNA-processing factor 19 n=1 Tax=Blumeria graminis f. sp. hordei (strain DH14) TaxID=546991 RepID=N1JBD5_BLUG1|nr:cell cycle control protein cwf8/ubiquitin-protein ligase E4 [Blumeria hordei DH14]
MLCSNGAVSGETPKHPVASSKSGNVYEKHLIEAFISQNHKDPVNGEDLEVEDLIPLKSARIVVPRPPTLTSIPALLSTFQNEWDSLAVEIFTLRKDLQETRQELSTSLYQHDAAVRVIARLTRERDQARDALSKVTVNPDFGRNEDAMQIDNQGLPEELAATVDATLERLSKSRRKRPIPNEWADVETVRKFETAAISEPICPISSFLAFDEATELAIIGGLEGVVNIFSVRENKVHQSFNVTSEVTSAIWYDNQAIVSMSSGEVKILGPDNISFQSHSGSATCLALHPCGTILASAGLDKSFVLYDLEKNKPITQVYTNSDGHLFAAGGRDGQIKLFHVKTGEKAAIFTIEGPVCDIAFSENGIWLSVIAKGSSCLVTFDLRKEGKSAEAKLLETGGPINRIRWDYTGQYLAAAGPRGIVVHYYVKSTKTWSNVNSFAIPARNISWGPKARSLIALDEGGIVKILR